MPVIESKRYQRFGTEKSRLPDRGKEDDFYFGIDLGPDWFAPLGEHFAKSQKEIEQAVRSVIVDDWHYQGKNRWQEDERRRRKIFDEGEAYGSHGSRPRTDDLQFYLSYHGMMVVAGKLLATTPTHVDAGYPGDDFFTWLSHQGLSRADGGWLADRRDPIPLGLHDWRNDPKDIDWRWSVRRDDFDKHLVLPDSRINLWGSWTTVSGDKEESVQIKSALVARTHSDALLRALYFLGPYDYVIPPPDGDFNGDDGFQLKAWIAERNVAVRLDEYDPWSGSIDYPAGAPGQFVIDLIRLESDAESRVWTIEGGRESRIVLWAQTWGQYREKNQETDGERGNRLQASLTFVTDFLRQVDMDLAIQVQIDHRITRSRYRGIDTNGFEYIPASTRLFLAKPDGRLYTI
jgi:hypothetical protein